MKTAIVTSAQLALAGLLFLAISTVSAYGGGPAPNVTIPPIPKCYSFTSDEDELVQQLENLRRQTLLNFPLGVSPGDPEYEQAKAQQDANIAAIDDAIKQAKAVPLCPIKKAGAATGGTVPQTGGAASGNGGAGGGAGAVAPNVTIPKVPECFAFSIDKDEFLQQLQDLRKQVLLNFPLGVSPGEAEYDQAKAQQDANLAAIDAAIKQAQDTPMCIVKKHHKKGRAGRKHGKAAVTEDNPLYMENYQPPTTGTTHTSGPSEPTEPPPPPTPPSEPGDQPTNPYQHGMDLPNQPGTPPH
jgi:hypothetical protein